MDYYGNKCARCGFNDSRALQIDHVNDDGADERREIGGHKCLYWVKILRNLQKDSTRYQILCANCNWIKRAEGIVSKRLEKTIGHLIQTEFDDILTECEVR